MRASLRRVFATSEVFLRRTRDLCDGRIPVLPSRRRFRDAVARSLTPAEAWLYVKTVFVIQLPHPRWMVLAFLDRAIAAGGVLRGRARAASILRGSLPVDSSLAPPGRQQASSSRYYET